MCSIPHLGRFQHSLSSLCSPSFIFPVPPQTEGLTREMSGRALLCSRDCSPLFSATPSFWERENENKRLWNKWKTQLCVYPLNKSSIQIAFCWGPISQRSIKTQLHLQSYISISHPVSFSVQHVSHREQEKLWFVCLGGIRGRWCCAVDGWLH